MLRVNAHALKHLAFRLLYCLIWEMVFFENLLIEIVAVDAVQDVVN